MSLKQIIDNLSSVLSTELFEIGGTQVTLGTLLIAGLVIAFPQLDVHFDAPVEGGLGRLAAAS